MDKDQFWSVDKLIPHISTPRFSKNTRSEGISIRLLDQEDPKKDYGPEVCCTTSKVIRSYQLTATLPPSSDQLLKEENTPRAVPFVSCQQFTPSLRDLNKAQQDYLFFFFYCIAQRKKIPTCFSYLQLFLCKVIRQSLHQSWLPEEVFWTWESYRNDFPLVDKLFSDAISDFFFLAQSKPPYERLSSIFTEHNFTAKPFLLEVFMFDYLFSSEHTITAKEADLILRTITQESFRKSKAYRSHHSFSFVLEDALSKAIKTGLFNRADLNGSIFRIQIPSEVRLERRLFQGLPRDEIPISEISLRYVPLLRDENIHSRLDEVIRYLENRVRKILKLKNSLSRIHISAEHRAFLDGILLDYEYLSKKEEENATLEVPSSLPQKPRKLEVDFQKAAMIEENSWDLTESLTEAYTSTSEDSIVIGGGSDEAFDQQYKKEIELLDAKKIPSDGSEFWEFASLLSETEDNFMRIAIHSDTNKARQFCMANGLFFEAVILSCNEKATETIEDCVFDGAGNLFPDYLDELKNVFPPMEGEA